MGHHLATYSQHIPVLCGLTPMLSTRHFWCRTGRSRPTLCGGRSAKTPGGSAKSQGPPGGLANSWGYCRYPNRWLILWRKTMILYCKMMETPILYCKMDYFMDDLGVTPFMETVGNPHMVISKGFNGTFMGD